jgi:hypothetical protein
VEWHDQNAQRASHERKEHLHPFERMTYSSLCVQYLGYLPTPDTKPQDVTFFKIRDGGYDQVNSKFYSFFISFIDTNRYE